MRRHTCIHLNKRTACALWGKENKLSKCNIFSVLKKRVFCMIIWNKLNVIWFVSLSIPLVLHILHLSSYIYHHIVLITALQGWRSPGFVVSRASSYSSTSSCNSSDVSPSSSSPSLASRSSSPLPGEPRAPRASQSRTHTKTQPQTAR